MTAATESVSGWLSDFEAALGSGDIDARGGDVRRRVLLARSGVVHLEHQDARGPAGDRRHAPRHSSRTCSRAASALVGEATETDGVDRRVVRLRDRGGPRTWPHPAPGERVLDAADDDGRAQGLRGEALRRTPEGRRARRRQGAPVVAGAQASGRVVARLRRPAVLRHRRRRPGRHRPRRSPQAARRADDHPREEPASR